MMDRKYAKHVKLVKRKHPKMLALLQMIDIYHRKLKKVQSNIPIMARWGKPVKCGSVDLNEDETLFLKERRTQPGLLHRINAMNLGNKTETTETDALVVEEEAQRYSAYPKRSRTCTKHVKYNTDLFDADDDDNDFQGDDGKEQPAKKKTIDDWMTATGKIKPPKIRRVKLTIPEEDKPSNDPNENGGDGLGPDVNQNEMPNGKEGKRRSSKLLSGFKSGVSRVLHTMGISGTKPKLKIDASDILIVEDEEDGTQETNEAPEEIPSKRMKRQEESITVECPMCQGMFAQNEINDHAFTCNGEKPRQSRAQAARSQIERNPNFIPVETDLGFFADQLPARQTAKDKVFTEWQEATKKVSMGKSKTNGKEANSDRNVYARPPIDPDFVNSFGSLAKESAAMNKEDILDKEKPTAKKRKIKLIRPTQPPKQDKNSWLSDDEEEQDKTGLFNQYFGQEKPKRARKPTEPVRMAKRKQMKPKFDEEDSIDANEDEKCFVCGEKFTGISQKAYEEHVNECVDKNERMEHMKERSADFVDDADENSQREKINENEQVPDSRENRLKRRLGNNDAWTHYHKTKENGNGVDEDDTSDEENDNQAQFKSFKPIGPSSTFDFDNQFKNLPKQKINLSRRGVGRKRGKK